MVKIVSETGMNSVGGECSSDITEAERGGSLRDDDNVESITALLSMIFVLLLLTDFTKIFRTLTSILTFCLAKTGI